MKRSSFIFRLLLVSGLILSLTCCKSEKTEKNILNIVAGSETEAIEPIIQEFAKKNNFAVNMVYKGSVDMMLDLQQREFTYDAILAANSIWIRMGDRDLHRVSDEASVMRSPVVLGIKKPLAEELGWTDKDVTVSDILNAVRQEKLRFAMTSATQSNSGASAYIGLLFALANKPDMLTSEHLINPELQSNIKEIFGSMERGSGSSGWLNEMFISRYDTLNAMFNYEAMVIATNQMLAKQGRDPLYVIYPADGLAIADSTVGFVNKPDNADKKEIFIKLKEYLLSEAVQEKIFKTGFRTGLIGMNPDKADKSVFCPEWGIDLKRSISPIPWPPADVIKEAMNLYQTTFRKPSYTVYLLDISGSMSGEGLNQLKQAMTGLLDQNIAGRYLLQASSEDITLVITFNNDIDSIWKISGNRPDNMTSLMNQINKIEAGGGTNIYLPVINALDFFYKEGEKIHQYLTAIILMTDGMSAGGNLDEVRRHFQKMSSGFELPPIFCVTFGEADDRQLKELAQFSAARVFDGRKEGLIKAFRQAKGYN